MAWHKHTQHYYISYLITLTDYISQGVIVSPKPQYTVYTLPLFSLFNLITTDIHRAEQKNFDDMLVIPEDWHSLGANVLWTTQPYTQRHLECICLCVVVSV